jgi:hypothetical protein
MKLYEKLLAIQQRINGLGKDKKANNYSYVTGDKVLGEIKPLMNELGLILKQEITSIENERMDYKTGIGTNYEKPKSEILSKVMMRFTWVDCATGDKDENLFGANGQNDWDKGVGSALTYGERYFLLKFFHIATDEDDIDNPDRKPEEKQPTQQHQIPAKKPLLERGTAQFTAVINAINKGQVESIDMVKIKYDLLEPIEDELTALIKKVKA